MPTRVAFLMQIKRPIRPRDRPLLDAYYRLLARPRRGADTDDRTVDTVRDAVVLREVPTPGKSHRRCASFGAAAATPQVGSVITPGMSRSGSWLSLLLVSCALDHFLKSLTRLFSTEINIRMIL